MAIINFDANNRTPSVIPECWHPAVIINSENKPTKDGTGSYLQLEWQLVGGPFDGRTLTDRLNLINKNATAVEIAEEAMSDICQATGIMFVQDTIVLHNIPVEINIGIREGGEGQDGKVYRARNEILGYRKMSGQSQVAPMTPPPAQQAPMQIPPQQFEQAPAQQPVMQMPPLQQLMQQPVQQPATQQMPPAQQPQMMQQPAMPQQVQQQPQFAQQPAMQQPQPVTDPTVRPWN